jgi:hypothetical protein
MQAGVDTNNTPKREHTLLVDSDGDGANQFQTFWRAYPSRRQHPNPKKLAGAKFDAAVKRGVDSAEIIRGAERYADYVARSVRDPKFIAQAATWLTREGWTENHEASQPKRRPGMC